MKKYSMKIYNALFVVILLCSRLLCAMEDKNNIDLEKGVVTSDPIQEQLNFNFKNLGEGLEESKVKINENITNKENSDSTLNYLIHQRNQNMCTIFALVICSTSFVGIIGIIELFK